MLRDYPNKMMTTDNGGTGWPDPIADCPECKGLGFIPVFGHDLRCRLCYPPAFRAWRPIASGQVVARPNGDIAGTETA